ncbi:MAG: stage III sporulation protein AF [Lachnospiraceae bacterium]
MEFFYSWVRNIILFSLLASIALELIPSDNYRDYIQLFVGFLTVFLVIEPVIDILGTRKNVSLEAMRQIILVDKNQMEDDCKELEKREKERKKELYESQLGQQIREILEAENYKIDSQKVEVDLEEENLGIIHKVEIVLKKKDFKINGEEEISMTKKSYDSLKAEKENIKKIIKDFYQLDDSHIDVKVQE